MKKRPCKHVMLPNVRFLRYSLLREPTKTIKISKIKLNISLTIFRHNVVDVFGKKCFDITLLHGKKMNNDYHYK